MDSEAALADSLEAVLTQILDGDLVATPEGEAFLEGSITALRSVSQIRSVSETPEDAG